jgi:ABC-type Mn2+/Zn2+ transport system permease subunit
MKTASKVMIIISMVATAVEALITIVCYSSLAMMFIDRWLNENPGYSVSGESIYKIYMLFVIFTAIATVVGAEVVGGIALKKLATATAKNQLIAMGVLTIIFCSKLGGIFMLCIPQSDFPSPTIKNQE